MFLTPPKRHKAHGDPTEWEIPIHTLTVTPSGNHGEPVHS